MPDLHNKDTQNESCDCRCIHQKRVDAAHTQALSAKDNEQIAILFKALGDPNRLRILWALNYEEMCVCDLALFLGVSESAVSHQLRQLRQLNLVTNRREGPVIYYRISDGHGCGLIQHALERIRENPSSL
jgi:DNA-binding transcriptional ArsR family regulator